MKNLKNYSKIALAIFGFLMMSATSFAQAAKVVEIKGSDQIKYSGDTGSKNYG